MNRNRWSVVTVLAVALLMLASSTQAVPDATAYPFTGGAEIVEATATLDGDFVTVSGRVTGSGTIGVEELNYHASTTADAAGNFTMTFESYGSFLYLQGSDSSGPGEIFAVEVQ